MSRIELAKDLMEGDWLEDERATVTGVSVDKVHDRVIVETRDESLVLRCNDEMRVE